MGKLTCHRCNKEIPENQQKVRGRERKYCKSCEHEAKKKTDRDTKRLKRELQGNDYLKKKLGSKAFKELPKYLALSLRNSIYYSMAEKDHRYRSDYPEVQELIDLIEEMIWVNTRKNKPTSKEMLIRYLKRKGKYEDAKFWTKNYNTRLMGKR